MAKRQDFKRAGGRDTPRKPKRQRGKRPTLAGTPPLGYLNSFYCPVCGDHLFSVYDGDLARPDYHFRVSDGWNYCSRCGQAFDLGEFKAGKEEKEVGSRITVILSLHDRWWKKMVSREKLLEIRKTYPHIAPEEWPLRVLVYITGGVGVCGEFNCPGVQKIRTLPEVQSVCGTAGEYNVQAASCLKKEQLKKYAGDSGRPMWGWIISEVQEYEKPVPLEAYGISRPPQSWQYLKTEVEK